MGSSPLVSILLPTYNRSEMLETAVRSVLAQSYENFELIVIDDGSVDDTETVVKSFVDPRIVYVRRPHEGAAKAENKGLEISRGRFIAFIDDDDEWLHDKLRVQMEVFEKENEKTGVVYTGRWLIQNGRKGYGPSTDILRKNGDIHKELINRSTFVPLVCALVRRECFERCGNFDVSLPTSNDFDLWVRFSRLYLFKYIPQPLVKVSYTLGSISRNPENIVIARKILLSRYAKEFHDYGRRGEVFFLWQAGSMLILQGDIHQGRRYLFKAVRCIPWNYYYALAWLASLFGKTAYIKCFLEPTHRLKHFWRSRPIPQIEQKD